MATKFHCSLIKQHILSISISISDLYQECLGLYKLTEPSVNICMLHKQTLQVTRVVWFIGQRGCKDWQWLVYNMRPVTALDVMWRVLPCQQTKYWRLHCLHMNLKSQMQLLLHHHHYNHRCRRLYICKDTSFTIITALVLVLWRTSAHCEAITGLLTVNHPICCLSYTVCTAKRSLGFSLSIIQSVVSLTQCALRSDHWASHCQSSSAFLWRYKPVRCTGKSDDWIAIFLLA